MEHFKGKAGIIYPAFEEYPHRKKEEDIVPYFAQKSGFRYTADDLMKYYEGKEIETLVLVNPDNPSGNYIEKQDVLRLADWAREKKITLIIDESFVDFAQSEEPATLLGEEIIQNYPELIIVKSISKSFGVPGLRLGLLVSGQENLIENLKKDVAIWNINSFAEFFMQIFEKYKSNYEEAMKKFKQVRMDYVKRLEDVEKLEVFPSQANYVMCRLTGQITSRELAETLLDKYNILIKDLSTKTGFDGKSYIRLAVRRPEENQKLIHALKEELR